MLSTYNGRPRYDIKEVLKPAGDTKRQALLDELNDFRKLMLIYRLIHFHDPIRDIDIGIEGRHKELCKPVLQLFQNTYSLKEIQGAFQTLLNIKNQRKGNTIEAALHPIIVNLVSTNGKDLYAGQMWAAILEIIPGTYDEKSLMNSRLMIMTSYIETQSLISSAINLALNAATERMEPY
jgi:hypothetical protein